MVPGLNSGRSGYLHHSPTIENYREPLVAQGMVHFPHGESTMWGIGWDMPLISAEMLVIGCIFNGPTLQWTEMTSHFVWVSTGREKPLPRARNPIDPR